MAAFAKLAALPNELGAAPGGVSLMLQHAVRSSALSFTVLATKLAQTGCPIFSEASRRRLLTWKRNVKPVAVSLAVTTNAAGSMRTIEQQAGVATGATLSAGVLSESRLCESATLGKVPSMPRTKSERRIG